MGTCNDMDHADYDFAKLLTKIGGAALLVVLLIVGGCMAGMPRYNLYKAETAKRERIAEAKAESDAAQYTAEKQVEIAKADRAVREEEAKGIANATETINASLTPEYITWYFIDQLDNFEGQVIYVPTEGGVPVMEAGRAVSPERGN